MVNESKHKDLAAKYRPKKLSEVVGQDLVVSQVKGILKRENIGTRSLLFHGPSGVGKTTLSRLIAYSANCTAEVDARPCYECTSCKTLVFNDGIEGGFHPDVFNICCTYFRSVTEIQPILHMAMKYSTTKKYRIIVLDEVHMLSNEAQHLLLGPLENPPDHIIFCLCTTAPTKILETVVNRCQELPLFRVDLAGCFKILKRIALAEGHPDTPANDQVYLEVARESKGCPRRAIKQLERILDIKNA